MGLELRATGRGLGMHHFGRRCRCPECVLSFGAVAGEQGDDSGAG
jgi:hypothetical protein